MMHSADFIDWNNSVFMNFYCYECFTKVVNIKKYLVLISISILRINIVLKWNILASSQKILLNLSAFLNAAITKESV